MYLKPVFFQYLYRGLRLTCIGPYKRFSVLLSLIMNHYIVLEISYKLRQHTKLSSSLILIYTTHYLQKTETSYLLSFVPHLKYFKTGKESELLIIMNQKGRLLPTLKFFLSKSTALISLKCWLCRSAALFCTISSGCCHPPALAAELPNPFLTLSLLDQKLVL